MPKDYKILTMQRRDEWEGRFGPMVTYAVQLEGEEGWVKLNQKPDTPEPVVGQSLYGTVEPVNEGGRNILKFTKALRNQQASSSDSGDLSEVNRKLDTIISLLRGSDVQVDEDPDADIDLSTLDF